jgi:ATP-binding cassette subfamily F protein 3
VATNIIEVRDGSARAYEGGYEGYLYYINREIEEGERARVPNKRASSNSSSNSSATSSNSAAVSSLPRPLDAKACEKEMKSLQKKIKTLDQQRVELNNQMIQTGDASEAERLNREIQAIEMEIGLAEERWLELNAMEF